MRHGLPMDKRAPDTRPSSTARGYGSRWQRYRVIFLARQPLCARCLMYGRQEPAVVVDHVVPVKGSRDPMFWQVDNHQALCIACHNLKTAADKKAGTTRGGNGHEEARKDTKNGGDVLQKVAKETKGTEVEPARVKNPRGRPKKGTTGPLTT
jgi:5-methylcytosine-specific restriction protein A